ncbi:MAG: flippase-like domain-containing protein [Tissierellia bacterium]|nr:flippase-like domain-containing protein [Tissierellia bacterium]
MKKYLKWIIILLLIVLLFKQLDINEYLLSLKKLSLNHWLALIMMQLLSFALLLVQWRRLATALGKDIRTMDMVYVNMKGTFYDTITPGLKVGGEFARGSSLVNKFGFTPAEASALIIIQKSISVSALVLLSIFSLYLLSTQFKLQDLVLVIASISFGVILALLITILLLPEKLYNHLASKRLEGVFKEKNLKFLEKYTEASKLLTKAKKEIVFQFVLSLIVWTLFPFKLYFIIQALGLELSFFKVFAATIISYIAGMLPLLPGGLGSFEGTMVALFLIWGIERELSLVIATIFRFITFWFLFFISLVYLAGKKAGSKLKGVPYESSQESQFKF